MHSCGKCEEGPTPAQLKKYMAGLKRELKCGVAGAPSCKGPTLRCLTHCRCNGIPAGGRRKRCVGGRVDESLSALGPYKRRRASNTNMSTVDTVLLTVLPTVVAGGSTLIARFKYGWLFSEFKTWQLLLGCLHLSIALTMYGLTGASNDAWEVIVRLAYNKWDVNDIGACSDSSPCYIELESDELGTFKTTFLVPFFSVCSGLHHLYAAYSLGRGDGVYRSLIVDGINVASSLAVAVPMLG